MTTTAVREPATAARPAAPRRRRSTAVLLLVPFLAVGVWLCAGAWRHPATVLPGAAGDSDTFIWGLRWFAWAVSHGHDPFVSTYVRPPGGINVLWNAWMPPVAVLLIPVTLLFGPVASYLVLLTAGYALSGFAAWRAAARVADHRAIAYTIGLLYEVSPFLVNHGQAGHPMLILAVYPPVVVILFSDLLAGRRSPQATGVWLGIATGVQFWLDEEITCDVALLAGVAVLVLLVRDARLVRRWIRPALRTLVIAAIVGGVLAAPALLIQFLGPDHLGTLRSDTGGPSIDLANVLSPGPADLASRVMTDPTSFFADPEATGYLGVPVVVALLSFLARRRDRAVSALALTAFVGAVLEVGATLRLNGYQMVGHMPWQLLESLPLLKDLESVRLTLEVFLLVMLLAGMELDRWISTGAGRRRWAAYAVGAVCIASLLPSGRLGTSRPTVPHFFTAGATAIPAGCVAAVLPVSYDASNTAAMVWQQASDFRFRMLDGYVLGPLEPGQRTAFAEQPEPFLEWVAGRPTPDGRTVTDADARANLRQLHVCAVVLGYPDGQQPLVASLTRLLGEAPQRRGDVALWSVPDVAAGSTGR